MVAQPKTPSVSAKVVDAEDGNEENGNKDAWVERFAGNPVLNDQGGGGKLVGRNDEVFEEVAMAVSIVIKTSETGKRACEDQSLRGAKLTTSREQSQEKDGNIS